MNDDVDGDDDVDGNHDDDPDNGDIDNDGDHDNVVDAPYPFFLKRKPGVVRYSHSEHGAT